MHNWLAHIVSAFNVNNVNYINYENRLKKCKLMSFFDRRTIHLVLFMAKILKNKISIIQLHPCLKPTPEKEEITFSEYNQIHQDIHLYFAQPQTLINTQVFSLDESIETIKNELKNNFLQL